MRALLGKRFVFGALVIATAVYAAQGPSAGGPIAGALAAVNESEPAPPPPPPPPPPAKTVPPGKTPEASTAKTADTPAPAPPPPPPPPAGKPGEKPAGKVAPAEKAPSKSIAGLGEKGIARPNQCLDCHGNPDVWEGERLRLHVTEKDLAADFHWQKGLRCVDCHGGNPATDKVNEAHAEEDGFRRLRSQPDFMKPPEPVKVVEMCGNCHANIDFMRPFNPKARVDQLREYWTSGHGRRLKESNDTAVATCVSCHGQPHGSAADKGKHGVRPVAELDSPVYRKNVATTCSKCHADEKRMAGRKYHGQEIGHSQYDQWRGSVHAQALLQKGDLSAATCNDCHGNHGALPPDVDSVANACGTCHGKIAGLFANTRMKHAFEKVGQPGCATCHGKHGIQSPSVQMIGMTEGAVCLRCHEENRPGKYGATVAGSQTASKLRSDLEGLQQQIQEAEDRLAYADRLGMAIPGPRSDPKADARLYLRKAGDALTGARVEIHSFALAPVEKFLATGQEVASEVQESADSAIYQHSARRIWLAASLVPILLVIVVLVLYARSLPASPPPTAEEHPPHEG